MSLGPWFKCYPRDWLQGIRDLSLPAQGAYAHLVMRMYDSADAIYVDDRKIGKWLNSNARGWAKVKQELIAEGKLVVLSDGGLIDPRCLQEMAKQCETLKEVPPFICERIAKLSDMFSETFANVSQKFPETAPKKDKENKPPLENSEPELEGVCVTRELPENCFERSLEAMGLDKHALAGSPGLLNFSTITNLIRPVSGEPADFEADVIPNLMAARGRNIKSWEYFRAAILESRDRRIQGNPEPTKRAVSSPARPKASREPGRSSVNLAISELLSECRAGSDDGAETCPPESVAGRRLEVGWSGAGGNDSPGQRREHPDLAGQDGSDHGPPGNRRDGCEDRDDRAHTEAA